MCVAGSKVNATAESRKMAAGSVWADKTRWVYQVDVPDAKVVDVHRDTDGLAIVELQAYCL